MSAARDISVTIVVMVLLTGCVSDDYYHPAPGQKMHITQYTLNGFKEYQQQIGSIHDGVFAVSSEGRSYSYFYCSETACSDRSSTATEALQSCAKYGEKCYIFAHGNDIKVDYEVVP